MLRLKLSAIALAEANDAISFYRNISQNLGTAFRNELTRSLDLLLQRPDIGSKPFAHLFPGMDVRAWSIDRFPYQMMYTADHRTLRVIRISHERRSVGAASLQLPHKIWLYARPLGLLLWQTHRRLQLSV